MLTGIHRRRFAAVLALVGVAGALTSLFLAPAIRAAAGREVNGDRVERATLLHMEYLIAFEPFIANPSGCGNGVTSAPFAEDTLVIPALRIEGPPDQTNRALLRYSIEFNASGTIVGEDTPTGLKSMFPLVGYANLDFKLVEYNGATYVMVGRTPSLVRAGEAVRFSAKLDYKRPQVPADRTIQAQPVLLCRPASTRQGER